MFGNALSRAMTTRFAFAASVILATAIACNSILGIDPPITTTAPEAGVDGGADAAACVIKQGMCNPFPQCGCDAGEDCEVTGSDGTTSCSTATATPLYANCDGYGTCPKGAQCIGGVCKPFCDTAADCPGYRLCIEIHANGYADSGVIPGLKVCTAGCDPLSPSAVCGPDASCNPFPLDGKGKDVGDCFGHYGTGIGPGACMGAQLQDCAPGYYCITSGECAKWCRVGHNEDCTNAYTCQAFVNAQAKINGVPYGVCLP